VSHVMTFIKSELLGFCNIWTAYDPERYYMRGRGPKRSEKHAGGPPMRIDGANRDS
jgi:hypothetical protein